MKIKSLQNGNPTMLISTLLTDCANYRTDVCLIGCTVRAIISDKQGGMHDEFN